MRIAVGSRGVAVLALVALSGGVTAAGCSSPSASTSDTKESSGSIGLELQAGGVQLNAVSYAIVGSGGFSKTGTLNVANSTQISAVIGGIPAANGYSITLSAVAASDASITCAGSAAFNVTAGATTSAQVHLTCKVPPRTGSVAVNGSLNVCPVIDSVSAEPSETTVGNAVQLSAAASDADQAPNAISYAWTTTSGTLAGANTAVASLTCMAPGTATVTLLVSDGDCTDTATATVTCSPAPGGGGGGGGASGSGGLSGAAGSGGAAGAAGTSAGLPNIKINEVESNGGIPGDWCELYNAGSIPVDISGWIFKDNDDTHSYAIPNGTVVQPGGYYVLEVANFVFGLGAPDATRLFNGTTLVDSYSWTTHATVTYGRCPNGSGDFVDTASSTKGAANDCGAVANGGAGGASGGSAGSGGASGSAGAAGVAGASGSAGSGGSGGSGGGSSAFSTWPGGNSVVTVDNANVFGSNLSGLFYDPPSGGSPAVLWAVQNGPSKLYRLLFDGSVWAPDTSDNWAAGHTITYTTGLGGPDSEGVTKAAFGTTGLYVSTERDNTANTVSRLSVLLYDSTTTSATVSATMDWNLSPDFNLPAADANLGLEAITWVPDSYLTRKGFIDETTNTPYDPTRYPNHAGGIFFVGLEANGLIYAYALNHSDSSFTRVATIASGNPSIMDLSFDRDVGYLWAACDNTCNGRTNVLDIDTRVGSPTLGKFYIRQGFERPSTMPNTNNEGFTVTPESTCQGGFKNVFYSDDANLDGHAIRRDSIPCGLFLN